MRPPAAPYHLVPSETKEITSILDAVVVSVGAEAEGHVAVTQEGTRLPVASCFNRSKNDLPAAAAGIVITGVAAFSVIICTVPFDKLSVIEEPELAVYTVSVYPVTVGVTSVGFVSVGPPVQFVSTPEVGVPKIGVTSVGLVLNTTFPDPVLVVTPVPPEVTGRAAPSVSEAA